MVPSSKIGWWAIGLAALGVVAWTVLPVVGGIVGDADPAVSSGAMATGMVLVGIAAVFNVLTLTLWKQRSVLNIAAGAVTIPSALVLLFLLTAGGFFGGS